MPAAILTQVAVPSLALLYLLDEGLSPAVTVKAIGHQWYWSYEYSDFWREGRALEFDSYMAQQGANVRLLRVDNRAVLPTAAEVRVVVGSADVLHA